MGRLLFCVADELPGASAASARMLQWVEGFGAAHVDALCVAGPHSRRDARIGATRVIRVPLDDDDALAEQIFRRAVHRQLASAPYDLAVCADLGAATACATAPGAPEAVPLVVDVAAALPRIRARQERDVRDTLRTAKVVMAPAKATAEQLLHLGARAVHVLPRAVDLVAFDTPSIEVRLEQQKRVAIFGGRESREGVEHVARLARALAGTERGLRVDVVGRPSRFDPLLREQLGRSATLTDIDGTASAASAVADAHLVIVPTPGADVVAALPHRLLEAMACGRAVVVLGDGPALVDGAGRAFVRLSSRDGADVTADVLALLRDDKQRQTLGREAARYCAEQADLTKLLVELEGIVRATTGVRLSQQALPDAGASSTVVVARAETSFPFELPTDDGSAVFLERDDPTPLGPTAPGTGPGGARPEATSVTVAGSVVESGPVATEVEGATVEAAATTPVGSTTQDSG